MLPTGLVAEKSTDPFPMLDNIWNLFARKGNKTVFLSVGGSKTCLPDLELAETLGCPIHPLPITAKQRAEWDEVGACLKARSRPVDANWEFSAGAEEKWILPKNYRIQTALPWWTTGTVSVSGEDVPVSTRSFFDVAGDVCRAMNLPDTRLDILKVDVGDGLERAILGALLEHNLRPAIVLVRWSHMPDKDTSTSIAAGHLQNCGYALLKTVDDKFLYFFTDQDMYMSCSWEGPGIANPLVEELIHTIKSSMNTLEGHERALPKGSISPVGETAHELSTTSTTDGS